MINGLSGRPGAGKTYECVTRHIIPALNQGRKIITNIPLNIDWFVNVYGEEVRELIVLVDGQYHNYGGKRPFSAAEHFLKYDTWRNEKNQGVYFFIDECHLAMPAGGTDKELKEYLSMHRHYGHDIMLLTQNYRKVDRDIKDMVNTCYFCTKLSMLARDDKYVVKVADGVNQRSVVNKFEREYEKKYFAAYQSHTKAQASVKEASTVGVVPWYLRGWTLGSAGFVVLAMFIFGMALSSDKENHEEKAKEALAHLTDQPAKATQPIDNSQPASQLASQPPVQSEETQLEPEKKRKSASHPFEGLQIHLSGYYADNDNRGRFKKLYYFALSRNGQLLSEMTNVDLQLAGYNVRVYNYCAAEITYDDYHAFVLCDTPKQSADLPVEQLTASN